jgi:hypothetical protein
MALGELGSVALVSLEQFVGDRHGGLLFNYRKASRRSHTTNPMMRLPPPAVNTALAHGDRFELVG